MRSVIIAFGVIILSLLGAGYASLNNGLGRIEATQLSMKAEFIKKVEGTDTKVDMLCKKLDQHDSWLRVPFDTRQKYFLQDLKKGMIP